MGDDGVDEVDLQDHLRSERMAKQYWPERLEIREALPKTASGKIQKFLLRDEPATSAARSVGRDR